MSSCIQLATSEVVKTDKSGLVAKSKVVCKLAECVWRVIMTGVIDKSKKIKAKFENKSCLTVPDVVDGFFSTAKSNQSVLIG
jgi:RPA family protein